MAWLLEIRDGNGKDLYPEIKEKAAEKNNTEKHSLWKWLNFIRNTWHNTKGCLSCCF